jgi:hypothetical protein
MREARSGLSHFLQFAFASFGRTAEFRLCGAAGVSRFVCATISATLTNHLRLMFCQHIIGRCEP